MKKQTTMILAFAAMLGLAGVSTAQAGDYNRYGYERGYHHGYKDAKRKHHREHKRKHAREYYRSLFELMTIANDQPGDEAERRDEDPDDQGVEQEDPLLIRGDNPVDLLGNARGKREDFAEYGIEFLVQVATDHTGGVSRFPTLGEDAVEFADVLAQQLQILPRLRQHRYLAERRAASVDCRADQELGGLNLRPHVLLDTDVSIAAERFFEPQVRGRHFLLHGLYEAHEERIALEVPRYEPL